MGSNSPSEGTAQKGKLQLVEVERVGPDDPAAAHELRCPDCGDKVAKTKTQGGHRTPGGYSAFGWYCEHCNNVMPANAVGPGAPHWVDYVTGVEAEFRGGHTRYIPVSKSSVDDVDRDESQQTLAPDGGRRTSGAVQGDEHPKTEWRKRECPHCHERHEVSVVVSPGWERIVYCPRTGVAG